MMNMRKTLSVKGETIVKFFPPTKLRLIQASNVSRFTFHVGRHDDRAAD